MCANKKKHLFRVCVLQFYVVETVAWSVWHLFEKMTHHVAHSVNQTSFLDLWRSSITPLEAALFTFKQTQRGKKPSMTLASKITYHTFWSSFAQHYQTNLYHNHLFKKYTFIEKNPVKRHKTTYYGYKNVEPWLLNQWELPSFPVTNSSSFTNLINMTRKVCNALRQIFTIKKFK